MLKKNLRDQNAKYNMHPTSMLKLNNETIIIQIKF